MATFVPALARLAQECEPEGMTMDNSEKIGEELAKLFAVQPEEVGLLKLEDESLVFVHPARLHNVGRIPLNTSTSLAVRTVNSRRPEILNNFARTRHASFFEMVDVSRQGDKKGNKEHQVIQKLMSAPVIFMNDVVGVIQICRKGQTAPAAGRDFMPADLQKLVMVAVGLSKCFAK